MAEVPVNGKVLEWARTIRGLNPNSAAMLLGIPLEELLTYESGERRPLVGLLRQMSAKYSINFSSLLMPEPLPIQKPPVDHRARRKERPLSLDTLLAIEEVSESLNAFEEFAGESDRIVPRLSIGTAAIDENPESVAARERKRFGVSMEEQRAWRPAQARREWRKRIEDRGVFTYMIPMPPEELSGFSMSRDGIAAICVNDREATEGRKVFTLFHEYAHLVLRQTGISDENNHDRVERFCNEFAASFLVPKSSLAEAVDVSSPKEFSDTDIKRLAAQFRVSNAAIALRLEKAGLAPKGFYGRRIAPWDVSEESRLPQSSGKPNAVTLRIKRIGKLHAKTVLRAVDGRLINSFDASQLIGLQPSSLSKVQAAVG